MWRESYGRSSAPAMGQHSFCIEQLPVRLRNDGEAITFGGAVYLPIVGANSTNQLVCEF
jgi:hypothetical protein